MKKFKIVTYNVRCQFDGCDGVNNFIHRAGDILCRLEQENADVICFQEVTDQIRCFLNKYMTDYILVGHGRDAGRRGEGISIAFKKDLFEMLYLEHFWMSDTPSIPASRFKDQSPCPRICPVVVLKYKEAQTPIIVCGVHLDHWSDSARVLGMQAILNKIKDIFEQFGNVPTFILGDFNCTPDSLAIKLCVDNGLVDAAKGVPVTFHNFNNFEKYSKESGTKEYATDENGVSGVKIDYIFTDKQTARCADNLRVWSESKDGIYLSDHYPISCEFAFREL